MLTNNSTFNNAKGGINVAIGGTTVAAMASAINGANLFGITANTTSNKININYAVPGPVLIVETDLVHTPLANAGIVPGEYGTGNGVPFFIAGTVANPTFNASSYFGLGINWNAILNSVPQNERGPLKEIQIAQNERQNTQAGGFRKLNVWVNTKSPVQGHPWTT